MSRRFRLATVERLRSAGLDRATQDLAAARRAVVAVQDQLAAAGEELAACTPGRTATPYDLSAAAARREMLREKAELLRGELAARQEDVVRTLSAWHTARADLRAVEALHERHKEAQAQEAARREQRLIDDLAGALTAFPGLTRRPSREPSHGPSSGPSSGPWRGGDAA